MIEVINFLIKSVATCETRDFLVGLISKLEACLRAGDRCQLPSSKAARVWSSFHRLRVDPDLRVAWANFLSSIHLPVTLRVHSVFALQLVVDRLLKKLISMRMDDQLQTVGKTNLSTLTLREQNVSIVTVTVCAKRSREVWQVPQERFLVILYWNSSAKRAKQAKTTVTRYSRHFCLTGKQRPLPQLRPYLQLENATLQQTPESKKFEREYCQVNWNDLVKRFNVCFNVMHVCCTA